MAEYASTTTLERIRAASPCPDGWTKLLNHLGKTEADDAPLDIVTILDSNGLDDALWVLSYAMPDDRLARHFQAWCAEQVLPLFEAKYPDDMRVRLQIAMLRNDRAGAAARDAAWAAAWAATRAAARDAARDAAWAAAARTAAWSAARTAAARTAAKSAARTAAWLAAWPAEEPTACPAQEQQLRKMLAA